MDDVRAVLDAGLIGRLVRRIRGRKSQRLFAATYPARVRALVLLAAAFAKRVWSPDYPGQRRVADRDRLIRETEDAWGTPDWPSPRSRRAHHGSSLSASRRFFRRSASPGAAVALRRMNNGNRHPCGVAGDQGSDARAASQATRGEAGGRPVDREANSECEVHRGSGEDHLAWAGDVDPLLDEVEFLTGMRRGPSPIACSPRCCSRTSWARP